MQKTPLLSLAAAIAAFSFSSTTTPAHAAACGHEWAEPGVYKITGNFRGKRESAGAELTRDCRIRLRIPGVYTGGPVRKDGKCVRFTFKIEDHKKLFKGQWCENVAKVNWKGKLVQANIRKVRQGAK